MVAPATSKPWYLPRPMAGYATVVKGFPPLWLETLFFFLTQFDSLSLSSSPSLSTTSSVNRPPLFLHHFTSNFLKPLNSFLISHCSYKYFIFLPKFHPNSPSTLHLLHSKFFPFHIKSFIFLLKNLPSFFHSTSFAQISPKFSQIFLIIFSPTTHFQWH